jgi:hypothetical protein
VASVRPHADHQEQHRLMKSLGCTETLRLEFLFYCATPCLNLESIGVFVVCTLAKNPIDHVDVQGNRSFMSLPLVTMLCYLSCEVKFISPS